MVSFEKSVLTVKRLSPPFLSFVCVKGPPFFLSLSFRCYKDNYFERRKRRLRLESESDVESLETSLGGDIYGELVNYYTHIFGGIFS